MVAIDMHPRTSSCSNMTGSSPASSMFPSASPKAVLQTTGYRLEWRRVIQGERTAHFLKATDKKPLIIAKLPLGQVSSGHSLC